MPVSPHFTNILCFLLILDLWIWLSAFILNGKRDSSWNQEESSEDCLAPFKILNVRYCIEVHCAAVPLLWDKIWVSLVTYLLLTAWSLHCGWIIMHCWWMNCVVGDSWWVCNNNRNTRPTLPPLLGGSLYIIEEPNTIHLLWLAVAPWTSFLIRGNSSRNNNVIRNNVLLCRKRVMQLEY